MRTSMRNHVRSIEDIFTIARLCEERNIQIAAITVTTDKLHLFLSSQLDPYLVTGKNYFQFGKVKLIPSVLIWGRYLPRAEESFPDGYVPILAYHFQLHETFIALHKAFIALRNNREYLDSYEAIGILKKHGGIVFMATSDLEPFPSQDMLDSMFAHHAFSLMILCGDAEEVPLENPEKTLALLKQHEFDGMEVYAPRFTEEQIAFLEKEAEGDFLITGGDGYSCDCPVEEFGRISLPETEQTKWVYAF